MGVIVPIVTSILFGILFPTGDITLDIKFMERALTFNVGKTLELLGCKLCYKNEDLVYERKDKNCSTCLVNDYDNRCGVIQTFVDKINSQSQAVESQCSSRSNWRVTSSTDKIAPGSYISNDTCAVEYTTSQNVTLSISNIDRRLFVAKASCISINLKDQNEDIEACKVIGMASLLSCDRLVGKIRGNIFRKVLKGFLIKKIDQNQTPEWNVDIFKIKQRTITTKSNKTITIPKFEPGYTFVDGCGIIFRKFQRQVSKEIKTCHDDPCLWHLTALKIRTNKIHDLRSWKANTDYYLGARVGGSTCNLIQIYGMSMLIPLLLNITFGFIVFYNDYTYETASKYELIPCFMMLYPQWKVLKYLVSYCFFHKDEHILRKEKMIYERDVATLEPYLEATIQV